jgi:hypothetical protein
MTKKPKTKLPKFVTSRALNYSLALVHLIPYWLVWILHSACYMLLYTIGLWTGFNQFGKANNMHKELNVLKYTVSLSSLLQMHFSFAQYNAMLKKTHWYINHDKQQFVGAQHYIRCVCKTDCCCTFAVRIRHIGAKLFLRFV